MDRKMRAGFKRSELQDIIVYFAYQTRHLTEIRLNKLIYAAEIYSIEILNKRLTDVPFIHAPHGPFSTRIYAEGEIISGTDIEMKGKKTRDGHESTFFVSIEGKKMMINLSDEKIAVLDKVVNDWKFKHTKDLTKFTKSTLPFRRSKFGEILDLDGYTELMRRVYSKEAIESVERSLREATEGKGRTFVDKMGLQEYYDGL